MSTSLAMISGNASLNPVGTPDEDQIIEQALVILEQRVFTRGPSLQSPEDVRNFLQLKIAAQPHEVFGAVFLDSKHQVLAYEPLFQGTIDSASVYPRVVLKRCMDHNAAALVLCHNHPSGCTEPSTADETLTQRLKEVLGQVDIRLLDHFIIGKGDPYSFAEHGLI